MFDLPQIRTREAARVVALVLPVMACCETSTMDI